MIKTPSEHDLHAYVDGHLDAEDRRVVEHFLAHNPARAAEVEQWQKDAQRLRAQFGGDLRLPANPSLTPAALRASVNRKRQHWRVQALAAVLCVGLGGVGGWQLSQLRQGINDRPMADAISAYQIVVDDGAAKPDFVATDSNQLQAWLDRHFQNATRLPDLSAAGFTATGGRMFATNEGPAAMVLYRDASNHAISFYVRPPAAGSKRLQTGERMERGVLAQYWSGQGYNYAFVSRDLGNEARILTQARQRAI
jgi:anti-sigma factor RsiW